MALFDTIPKVMSINDIAFNKSIIKDEEYYQNSFKNRLSNFKILQDCGIYLILNKLNGHSYIGKSRNLKSRLNNHKNDLRKNKHINKYLQRAWNLYGEENFQFVVLEYLYDYSKLSQRENKLIKIHNCEYNIIKVNKEGNFYHSDETKQKISIKNKERKSHKILQTPENIKKRTLAQSKTTYQFDINKVLINEWPSTSDAGKAFNSNNGNIHRAITTGIKAYGYYWGYTNKI